MNARRAAVRGALMTVIGGLFYIAIGCALLVVPHLWDWLAERYDRKVQRAYDRDWSRR